MMILAFPASKSRNSINRSPGESAAARLRSHASGEAEVEFVDPDDFETPIHSIDRETGDGILQAARTFHDGIGATDAVPVYFAGQVGSVTAAWKNILDRMSRIDAKVRQHKPVAMPAAAPDTRSGAGVPGGRKETAPFFGADALFAHGVGIRAETRDAHGETLSRVNDAVALDAVLNGLVAAPAFEGVAA